MGKSVETQVRVGDSTNAATVLLESTEVIVSNSPLRRRVKLTPEVRGAARVRGAWLELGEVGVKLGDDAAKWLSAIQNPKSVAAKLGLSAGPQVLLGRGVPADVVALVRASPADVVTKATAGAWRFVGVAKPADVNSLPSPPEGGALWVFRPKGPTSPVPEALTRGAARALGLVDVKVVGVSDTHSAEKYVWPKKAR